MLRNLVNEVDRRYNMFPGYPPLFVEYDQNDIYSLNSEKLHS